MLVVILLGTARLVLSSSLTPGALFLVVCWWPAVVGPARHSPSGSPPTPPPAPCRLPGRGRMSGVVESIAQTRC